MNPPRLLVQGGELLAVPAVHNRCVFAEYVNRITQSESTRPDAIAVELNHDAVLAVAAWMKELGVGPEGRDISLPSILGLMSKNRRIHPRHRDAAIRLQREHGLPLEQIDPAILHSKLDFSPVSLLCLSNTDSIIEGIRSAVELNIPVFGVDIGEVASACRGIALIQDPVLAQADLGRYVERNAPACTPHADKHIDGRRELVMAARLKCLLRKHRRILFTCGLGHWQQIAGLVQDPSIKPANDPVRTGCVCYNRAVVSPVVALSQMDILPGLSVHYEAIRKLPQESPDRHTDYRSICRSAVLAACRVADSANGEGTARFIQFLDSWCTVDQSVAPSLFVVLNAARMMVSVEFATQLAAFLITDAVKWVGPDRWPHLPYLRDVRSNAGGVESSGSDNQVQLEIGGRRSNPFHVAHLAETSAAKGYSLPPLPFDDSAAPPGEPMSFHRWVWPPCETLLFSIGYSAAEKMARKKAVRSPEEFVGSLHDGIDVKATLRSFARGAGLRSIRVKAPCRVDSRLRCGDGDDEPKVFLFDDENAVPFAEWGVLTAAADNEIRRHINNVDAFDRVVSQMGGSFVAGVEYYSSRAPSKNLAFHSVELRYLHGVVVFGSPSLCPKQSARWLEQSSYRRCPILPVPDIANLAVLYAGEHSLALNLRAWATTLILSALPYATRRLTLVAPSTRCITSKVASEAKRRGVELDVMPLGQIPPDQVERIRHQYFVLPRNVDTLDYTPEMQKAFGESPRRYLDQLPERIRNQLKGI